MKFYLSCLICLALVIPTFLAAQNAGDIGSYTSTVFVERSQIDSLSSFAGLGLASGQSFDVGFGYHSVSLDGESGRLYEADIKNTGGMLGYFHQWDRVSAGLLASFATNKIEAGPSADNNNSFSTDIDGNGFQVAAAAAKDWDNWSLNGMIGIGNRSYDGLRQFVPPSPNPALPKSSTLDTQSFFFRATLAYHFHTDSDWTFKPFLTAGFESVETDAFEEIDVSGNAGDEADVDSFQNDGAIVEGGVAILYTGNATFKPVLIVSYFQNLGNSELDLSWENPPLPAQATQIPNPGQSLFKGDLGATADFGNNWSLSGLFGYQNGDSYSGYGVNVVVDYAF